MCNTKKIDSIPFFLVVGFHGQVAEGVRVPQLQGRPVPGGGVPLAAVLAGPAQHLHVASSGLAIARNAQQYAPRGPRDPYLTGIGSVSKGSAGTGKGSSFLGLGLRLPPSLRPERGGE